MGPEKGGRKIMKRTKPRRKRWGKRIRKGLSGEKKRGNKQDLSSMN